ncbi:3-hydroxy-9,10-secoandrosta-1,3,5(10)-triene-9,17-dione monooxygenase reductase subunit [Rhodococcus sp. NPDC127528]|uniref:3-hydroxy-9,10-secoandrosta-1,3,5(10)-triene-9, 17-dione monooxygenase reductase subunit n=1 Tax=unclassified Rhodococcus (in: high G+C Gram-positive bacteria) TaxID=192944 RepID=UPI0036323DDA
MSAATTVDATPGSTDSGANPTLFRTVLGSFCTGVAVIATVEDGEPVGFACQSFSALSLDPPLILFCPSRNSRAWHAIERVGRFTVNVLAEDQLEVSSTFGRRGQDKFAGTRWTRSPGGAPVLDGVLAWIDCEVADVLDGGDHHIVTGRVTGLATTGPDSPLLFYRGTYATVDPAGTNHLDPAVRSLVDRRYDWF